MDKCLNEVFNYTIGRIPVYKEGKDQRVKPIGFKEYEGGGGDNLIVYLIFNGFLIRLERVDSDQGIQV